MLDKFAQDSNQNRIFNRRLFLRYMVGGGIASVALGYLFPQVSQSWEIDLETLCSEFPYNSRCRDYLPGVQALDQKGKPIKVSTLLATAQSETAIPTTGLPQEPIVYLVIDTKHQIAEYAIRPICTHLGCTVDWKSEQQKFICPCHGSEYDFKGRVVKGPAHDPLPLLIVVVKQNQVRLVDKPERFAPR